MKATPPPTFRRDRLRPGMILHGRDLRPGRTFGRLIRSTLTHGLRLADPAAPACWGNHDGLVVRLADGRLGIGDSAPLRARVTPLEHYELEMAAGRYAVRIFDVLGASDVQRVAASLSWQHLVLGTWYDLRAFPWLLAKNLFQGRFERVRNWRWAYWCTEGCRAAWDAVGLDPWDNPTPTPLTTEKRAWPEVYGPRPGLGLTFRDVSEQVMEHPVDWRLINGEWEALP